MMLPSLPAVCTVFLPLNLRQKEKTMLNEFSRTVTVRAATRVPVDISTAEWVTLIETAIKKVIEAQTLTPAVRPIDATTLCVSLTIPFPYECR
jgi:hypothetical protein